MTNYVEKGGIFFFYRPKVDVDKIRSIDDVQRLHLVLVADNEDTARLFVVGRKQLPEIIKGKSRSTEREWMMNYLTGKPKAIGDALAPLEYQTKTRGEQEHGEAIPVGEGRYVIFERNNSTLLAYHPANPSKAQDELGILREASYIISVRNPAIDVPGFPDSKPDYPKALQDKFADKRWIDIDDTRLLDYESAQLLLIGAHSDLSEENIDITGKADLFKTLGLKKREWPTEALEKGKLTEPTMQPESAAPKGGERGGKHAMQAPSAARFASLFAGINFPVSGPELKDYARPNASEDEMDTLEQFGDQTYNSMADVAKELGRVS